MTVLSPTIVLDMNARRAPRTNDPVTQKELADRCGLNLGIVRQWIVRDKLPPPDYEPGGTKLWAWETLKDLPFIAERLTGPLELPGLTVEDAAEELGVHVGTVRRMIDDGRLQAELATSPTSGRKTWAVSLDSINEYLASVGSGE